LNGVRLIISDRGADEIARALTANVEKRAAPATIYHYTNAAGLAGILGERAHLA